MCLFSVPTYLSFYWCYFKNNFTIINSYLTPAVIVYFMLILSAVSAKVPVLFSSLSVNCCHQNCSLITRWTAYNVSQSILKICALGCDMKESSKKLQIFSSEVQTIILCWKSRPIFTSIYLHYSITSTLVLNSYWIYSVLGYPNSWNWRPVTIGI